MPTVPVWNRDGGAGFLYARTRARAVACGCDAKQSARFRGGAGAVCGDMLDGVTMKRWRESRLRIHWARWAAGDGMDAWRWRRVGDALLRAMPALRTSFLAPSLFAGCLAF